MREYGPGERARIDRLLEPGFAAGLDRMGLETLRGRRRDARQEEADLSYVRRMLQGRIDLVRAELRRRAGENVPEDVVIRLRQVLADEPSRVRASARYLSVAPSPEGEFRYDAERLLADVQLSDLRSVATAALREALDVLVEHEHRVSASRRAVQGVIDRLSEEVARRYRDGEAQVDDLLADG